MILLYMVIHLMSACITLSLKRCIETNLVLKFEKCHFMVEYGVALGHVVSSKGLEVNKAKVEITQSLLYS